MKKTRPILTRAVALALFMAFICWAGYAFWIYFQFKADVDAAIPSRPDLRDWTPLISTELDRLETLAENRSEAVMALGSLGRVYHANGFYEEASQVYQGLLYLDSENPRWPHLLANILSGYGQLEDAIPLYERVIDLESGYIPAYLRLGDALLKTNQTARAEQIYSKALEINPRHAHILMGLARLDIDHGDWISARDRLQAAVRIEPELNTLFSLLAAVYENLGEKEEAIRARALTQQSGRFFEAEDPWLDSLIEQCYDVYRLRVTAATQGVARDPTRAVMLLDRSLEIEPDDTATLRQIGQLLIKEEQYPLAIQHLQKAALLEPRESDNWYFLFKAQSGLNLVEEADLTLARGLALNPDSYSLHLEKGRQLAGNKQFREALRSFSRADKLRPEEVAQKIELARVSFRMGNIEEGVNHLQRALAVDPENVVALTTMALIMIQSGDREEAKKWINRARDQVKVPRQDIEDLTQMFQKQFGGSPLP